MSSQIDGGYNANQNSSFEQLAPYLGSTKPAQFTSSLNGTSPFVGSFPNITGDKTFVSEVLAIYIRAFIQQRNTFATTPIDTDPPSINAILGDFLSTYNSSSPYYQAQHGNPPHSGAPTSTTELANDLVTYFDLANNNTYGFAQTPNNTPNLINSISAALDLVLQANLGLWTDASAQAAQLKALTTFDASSIGNNGLFLNPFTQNSSDPINLVVNSSIDYTYGAQLNTNTQRADIYSVLPDHLDLNNLGANDTRFSTGAGANLVNDIVDRSAKEFLSRLSSIGGTDFTGFGNFVSYSENYFVRFAYMNQYQQVFSAFNNSLLPGSLASATGSALRDFIYNIMYEDPTSQEAFISSQDFSAWYTKVQQDYLTALNGGPNLLEGVLSASAAKTQIIQRIYALIVLMISTIQKTTASQADQLKVLTTLQGEMTNLISKAPILTSTDDNALTGAALSDATQSTTRDELNQVVTAWTDTVRANRDFQKSLAQSVQTNVNSSNDAVNQQASMATALIQQLSTLLSAIYR